MIRGYRATIVTPAYDTLDSAKRIAEQIAKAVSRIKEAEVSVVIEYEDDSMTSMPWPPLKPKRMSK